MQLTDIRRLTPITQEYAYFQSSGFSPKIEPVIEETNRWAQFHNAGGAAPGINEKMLDGFEATRDKVAQSMNADSDEIVLGENTTIGINIVANGINWQAGDNVILSDKEHPGNRITWYSHVQRYGIELRFLEVVHDEEQMLEQFERLLDERTRVVSISHVCRRTGQRLPARALVDLAHDANVPVLLDGAQAYGAVPVDMRALDCDFYAFSGHKYIMAPQGTGGIFVRQDMIPWVQPSWSGSHSQKDFDMVGDPTLLDEAKHFEFETRNLSAFGEPTNPASIDRLAYADWWNSNGFLAIQLESVEAVINARKLAKPGIDLLAFGPNDLRFSMESLPHSPFKTVDECIRHVLEQMKDSTVQVSLGAASAEERDKYIEMGVTVLQVAPGM